MDENQKEPNSSGITGFLNNNQSQLATVLIAILLIIAGYLTYGYLNSKGKSTSSNPGFNEILTPTPSLGIKTETLKENGQVAGAYTVKTGDSLWKIAADQLGDGFRWKEIAQANNISTSSPILRVGQALTIPSANNNAGQVASGATTTKSETVNQPSTTNTKVPTTYTVVRGDNLWNIAQKLYGDGAKWHAIFDFAPNRLSMYQPDGKVFPLIHAGNILTIPALQ